MNNNNNNNQNGITNNLIDVFKWLNERAIAQSVLMNISLARLTLLFEMNTYLHTSFFFSLCLSLFNLRAPNRVN